MNWFIHKQRGYMPLSYHLSSFSKTHLPGPFHSLAKFLGAYTLAAYKFYMLRLLCSLLYSLFYVSTSLMWHFYDDPFTSASYICSKEIASGAELHGGPGGPRTTGEYQAHRYREIQSDRIRPAAVLRSFVILRAAAMRPFVSPWWVVLHRIRYTKR